MSAGADVVVFGGGLLGGAVARLAAEAGARVIVASRRSRPHAGLWRRFDAGADSRLPWLPRGALVVLAMAPRRGERPDAAWGAPLSRLAVRAARDGAASVTVCGPAGEGEPGLDLFARELGQMAGVSRLGVVRLPPLFGVDDRFCWPMVGALRKGGVGRLPRGCRPVAALWVDDAARAVLRVAGEPARLVLGGPEVLAPEAVAEALVARFGGSWRRRWGTGPWRPEELRRAPLAGEGEWDDARFGARTRFAAWVERLPGPRRRR